MRKLLHHEQLYSMMKTGFISKNKTLWFYLDHFARDRATRIEELRDYAQTGVTQICFRTHDDPRFAIELIGEKIAPALADVKPLAA